MLIGHLADVHLGAKLYGREELRYDTLQAFERSIDLLLKERVEAIVIAGDLFDRPRPENEFILEAMRVLRKAVDKGIKIILAAGDHDTPKSKDRSPLEILSESLTGVYYPKLGDRDPLEKLIIDLNNINFAVVPFPRGSKELKRKFYNTIIPMLAEISRKKEGKSILVGHFGLDEACRWDSVFPASRLPKEFIYVALGHVHNRIIGRGCADCPIYAYPGSLYPLKIDEVVDNSTKGPLLVDVSSKEPIIHELEVDVRKHYIAKARFNAINNLKERLKAKIESYLKEKGSVIHLDLEIPSRSNLITQVRSLVSELEKRFGVIIIYRLKTLRDDELNYPSTGFKDLDEIDLIAKFLEGNNELARLIVNLKNAIAFNEDESVIKALIDEIVDEKYRPLWERVLKRRSIAL